MSTTVYGRDLRVGDVIEVGYERRDTITMLVEYRGPLTCFPAGARLADFAVSRTGMTIPNDEVYELFARQGA